MKLQEIINDGSSSAKLFTNKKDKKGKMSMIFGYRLKKCTEESGG